MVTNTKFLRNKLRNIWLIPKVLILVRSGVYGLTKYSRQHIMGHLLRDELKEVGAHAQIVERHHDVLRRLLLRTEEQLTAEGPVIPEQALIAECS